MGSGFLCGWAWIPLYEYTRDERFLKAGIALADAADRLMSQYSLIRQDFIPEKKQWTTHTLDESGFGMEGLAELYRVTNDSRFKDIGAKYIEQHLAKSSERTGCGTGHITTTPIPPHLRNTTQEAWLGQWKACSRLTEYCRPVVICHAHARWLPIS